MIKKDKIRKITLQDIAERVGCSIGVVSKVLNHPQGNIRVSTTTVQKIQQLASELGYTPHMARTIPKKVTKDILLIFPEYNSRYLSQVDLSFLETTEKLLRLHGYNLKISFGITSPAKEFESCIGIIAFAGEEKLKSYFPHHPIVWVNPMTYQSLYAIYPDDEYAAKTCGMLLGLIGIQNVVYIDVQTLHRSSKIRRETFQKTCQMHGISIQEIIDSSQLSLERIHDWVQTQVQAIVTYHGIAATHCLSLLWNYEPYIRNSFFIISLAGYGETEFQTYIHAFCTPYDQLASSAVNMMVKILQGQEINPPIVSIFPTLFLSELGDLGPRIRSPQKSS